MKKRLLTLLLCLSMILSLCLSLTSCGDKTDEEAEEDISEEASESAITLTMWMVSKQTVTAKAQKAVSEAVNALTKSKYKIQLDLKFFTPDEYYEAVTDAMNGYITSKTASGEAWNASEAEEEETEEAVEEETVTNEWGLNIIKYPEAVANQVDIIYIGDLSDSEGNIIRTGESIHSEFVENGWLQALDEELSSSAKKIKEYVSPTLLSAVKTEEGTFAIPCNNIIGEYTYMLLDKALLQKYSLDGYAEAGQITKFDCDAVFNFVDSLAILGEKAPYIGATYEECLSLIAYYWDIDSETLENSEEFSVLGTYYDDLSKVSRGSTEIGFSSLLTNESFRTAYNKLNEYRLKGYFASTEEEKANAPVRFVTGDVSVPSTYEDSAYAVIVKYPTATASDIYGNMFGVFSGSKSLTKSMEIITYLNTDSEFRNLMQYGIKQGDRDDGYYNYRVVTTNGVQTVVRNNNDYLMNIESTGNVFIAYPETDMSADVWENGKVQNRQSLVNPLLGYDLEEFAEAEAVEEETVSINSDTGYNVECTYGYSKEILAQDETLSKWLSECDKAGKGVYVLTASVLDGQIRTVKNYVYNNQGDYSVEIFGNTAITRSTNAKKGTVSLTKTGADLYVQFVKANTKNGYTLAIVDFETKKNFTYNFLYVTGKIASTEVTIEADGNYTAYDIDLTGCTEHTPDVKKLDSILEFDFLNTETYQVDATLSLDVTAFADNEILSAWAKECISDTSASKNTTVFRYDYVDKTGEQDVYTIALLFYKAKTYYTVSLQPTGDKKNLVLTLNYTAGDSVDKEDVNSTCFVTFLRVTCDKNVTVTVNTTGAKFVTGKTTTGETNPQFRLVGNLNISNLQFVERLNKEVKELLAGITDAETFANVTKDLSVLLQVYDIKDMLTLDATNFKTSIVLDWATDPNSVVGNDMTAFNYQFSVAVNGGEVKRQILTTNEDEEIVVADDTWNGYSYVYFTSAYNLYKDWMTKYGYAVTK